MFERQNPATSQLPRQRISVNTQLHSFYSADNTMQFSVALWNDKISLGWVPASGQDARGFTRFDWQHRISSALSISKCAALVKKYDEKLKKYVNGEEPVPEGGKSIGVLVGGNTQGSIPGFFMISVNPGETGKAKVAVSILRNFNGGAVDPASLVTFVFGETEVAIDYSPIQGGTMVSESVNDFDVFLEILRSYALMLGMVSHETKYRGQFGGNRSNSNNNGGNTNSSYNNPAEFQMSDFSGADELPFA